MVGGELTCVADRPSRRDAMPTHDAKARAYAEYDLEMANAWRKGK
jgi:hypothetical protein